MFGFVRKTKPFLPSQNPKSKAVRFGLCLFGILELHNLCNLRYRIQHRKAHVAKRYKPWRFATILRGICISPNLYKVCAFPGCSDPEQTKQHNAFPQRSTAPNVGGSPNTFGLGMLRYWLVHLGWTGAENICIHENAGTTTTTRMSEYY